MRRNAAACGEMRRHAAKCGRMRQNWCGALRRFAAFCGGTVLATVSAFGRLAPRSVKACTCGGNQTA
eukprot:1201660-Lingulodinium_polyedra.AAC.1